MGCKGDARRGEGEADDEREGTEEERGSRERKREGP